MTDEIINGNSKNMSSVVNKEAVSAFKRKLKVVNNLIQKKLCGPFFKEHCGLNEIFTINYKLTFKRLSIELLKGFYF